MGWGCAGVIGGVLLQEGRMSSNASFARLLDSGEEWGNSQRPASVSGHKQCFERDRPFLYVSTRWMGKKCLVRYRKKGSGMRMKIGVSGLGLWTACSL